MSCGFYSQETLIQTGDPVRLRVIGTRVDANDIVSYWRCLVITDGVYNVHLFSSLVCSRFTNGRLSRIGQLAAGLSHYS